MPFFSCFSRSNGREGVGPTSLGQDENMAGERRILSIATQQELRTGASSQGTSVGTKGELKITFNPL